MRAQPGKIARPGQREWTPRFDCFTAVIARGAWIAAFPNGISQPCAASSRLNLRQQKSTPMIRGVFDCAKKWSGSGRGFFLSVEEALQVAHAGWMAQFAQRFGFDLADAFPSDVVHLPDLFQGALVSID